MSERVLVTGCCGYLGAWITVGLLRAGFAVRGSSREPDYARGLFDEVFRADAEGEALRARLEVVPGELLDAASWRGAAEGCCTVIHTACPVATDAGTPARAMLDPAVQGTENVLREAARAGGVRRFVYVSSVVALLDHHRPSAERDARVGPADWNDTASPDLDPYAFAKVRAERRARALLAELLPDAEFAAVLPGPVLGPPVAGRRVAASIEKTLAPLLDGQLRLGSVDLTLGLVDARDVAAAVVALARLPVGSLGRAEADSRFVCVSRPSPRLQDVADAIRGAFPAYARALPRRAMPLPRWLLLAAMRLTVTREAFSYTRAMLGRRVDYDTSLTESALGARFRPYGESVVDTVAWLHARGLRGA
jgi:nucleoside-diphosphate-sugar epimerase